MGAGARRYGFGARQRPLRGSLEQAYRRLMADHESVRDEARALRRELACTKRELREAVDQAADLRDQLVAMHKVEQIFDRPRPVLDPVFRVTELDLLDAVEWCEEMLATSQRKLAEMRLADATSGTSTHTADLSLTGAAPDPAGGA